MSTAIQFMNNNGRTYDILEVLNFNETDKKYYENSWQQTRAMLLRDTNSGEFVVAQYVGEHEWGFGYYTDNIHDADNKYNEIVREYIGV